MVHGLILVTLLAWGIAGIFDKQALKQATSQKVFVFFHLFNVPLLAGLLVASIWSAPWHFAPQLWGWQAGASFCGVAAMLLYYIALEKTDASYVLGITAAYPVVSSLLAYLLLGEQLSSGRFLGAGLVSLGVGMIGFTASTSRQRMSGRDLAVVIPCVIAATLLWGGVGVFEKIGVSNGSTLEAYFAETAWEVVFAAMVWAFWFRKSVRIGKGDGSTCRFAWLSALCVAVGNYAILELMSTSTATYAIVITACYPLVMYVLAVRFLKEPVNAVRLAGILLVILGGVLTEVIQLLGH